jgi:hypothetical protein
MATHYHVVPPIPLADLVGERLHKYGIRDAGSPKATERAKCLTDGVDNYLWAFAAEDGRVTGLSRYMPNGWPYFMLQAIATEFRVELLCEGSEDPPCYEPEDAPSIEEIAELRAEWSAECFRRQPIDFR